MREQVYIKLAYRSKRAPGPAENYAKFVFVFQKGLMPCDFKGSRKHRDTKIIGANDRLLDGYTITLKN